MKLACRIVFSIAVYVVIAEAAVRADWQYTKWGMSPDEVKAASDNRAAPVTSSLQRLPTCNRKDGEGLLKVEYEASDLMFDATFLFESGAVQKRGLTGVHLRAPRGATERVEDALRAKYGEPREARGCWCLGVGGSCRTLTWTTDTDTIKLVTGLARAELLYTPKDAALDERL